MADSPDESSEDRIATLERANETLRNENDMLRKALGELEAEKATLAHSFLGSSIRIRMLLQPPPE